MPSLILTVNSGSSSVKFALFTSTDPPARVTGGAATGLGTGRPRLSLDDGIESGLPVTDGDAARVTLPDRLLSSLAPALASRPIGAIAHRIVHGGPQFTRAVQVTPEVKDALTGMIALAPNHLPDELRLIDAFETACPGIPQVACFDTAFHRDLPEVSRTLPVPATEGVRRYGFHGLSYSFVLSELARLAGPVAAHGRVILAHLGNGASLAAVAGGRCIDTSMGLTPTGGLVMSSRSGDLDPGVVIYLARKENRSLAEVERLLTTQSGLLALSGRTPDMRELLRLSPADPSARLAVDVFCYQARKWIGAFAAALSGLDTLVFTGGIGEHSAEIRQRICDPLAFLGIEVDPDRNAEHAPLISTPTARVPVRIVPTDEALMMAREAHALLATESPNDARP